MSIKFELNGFDELLSRIEKAGGSIDRAVGAAVKNSAVIMQNELKTQMSKADIDADLISAMPNYEIEKDKNKFTVRVGYKKGSYDPENLSDGYKVVFLNYGTPNRLKHGKITARGFIQKAKKKAAPQIKKAQKEAFEKILKGLQ